MAAGYMIFNHHIFTLMRKLVLHITLILTLLISHSLYAQQYDDIARSALDSLNRLYFEPEQVKQRLETLREHEGEIADNMILGELYRQLGHYEQDYGNTSLAHINFQKALQHYSQTDSELSAYWQAECLVAIATEFYSLTDTVGLNNILGELENIYHAYPIAPIAYQYNHALYHVADCKYRYTDESEMLDSFFNYLYKTIAATRQLTNQQLIEYQINPAWDYFNLASGYDVFTSPKQIDSIVKYTNLCKQYIPLVKTRSDSTNLVYHVENERVWVQYYQHKYDSVEFGFNRLQDMLANDKYMLYRDLILNQQQLYLFMKEYNCAIGNYRNAYKYQQLQHDEERKIFDVEKMKAISNIEMQFVTERKEQDIKRLEQEKEIVRRNAILIAGSIIAVLVVFILLLVIRSVRKKNEEQQLYEAALEAEMQKESRNTNLRQIINRMSHDFPKYEKLFQQVDIEQLQAILSKATMPLTSMDIQYLIVFQGLKLKPVQVADMFNVEPASVYTVRYRIRKKFPAGVFDKTDITQ